MNEKTTPAAKEIDKGALLIMISDALVAADQLELRMVGIHLCSAREALVQEVSADKQ